MEKPKLEKIVVKRVADDVSDVSIGIYAEAEVSYKIENKSKRLEWFTSDGLWGIDPTSDDDYLQSIEKEEIHNLLHHLKRFGVNIHSISLGDKNKVIYKSEY